MRQISDLAWLEIDRAALRHNLALLRQLAGRKALLAPAVKANAYGHGLLGTSRALLPIGYYDGLDRKLSNCGEVLLRGRRAKILGRVCMDLTVIDISKIKNARVGDEVVIIGKQGKETVTADEVADKIGTINYEVVTRLRETLPRYYIN